LLLKLSKELRGLSGLNKSIFAEYRINLGAAFPVISDSFVNSVDNSFEHPVVSFIFSSIDYVVGIPISQSKNPTPAYSFISYFSLRHLAIWGARIFNGMSFSAFFLQKEQSPGFALPKTSI
jgi:hypothetical protein